VSGYPVVDVAIGLSFVFFTLSIFATSLIEMLAGLSRYRARSLERWLAENLVDVPDADRDARKKRRDTGSKIAARVLRHPLVYGMTMGSAKPSYVPGTHLVLALLEGGDEASQNVAAGVGYAENALTETEKLIDAMPDGPTKRAMRRLWHQSGSDVTRFRADAEAWFDDGMERLSGWYKRRTQVLLWILGLVFAVALDADTIRIAETLWNDQTLRQLVVDQAQHANPAQGASHQLGDLRFPLGWGGGAGGLPSGWGWPLKAIGLLLTAAAVSLGAPFWFDSLSKLAQLRNAGPKPTS
jgi:hypothetical protein